MQPRRWGEALRLPRSFFVQISKHHANRLGGISECLTRITRSLARVRDFGIGTETRPNNYWLEVEFECANSGDLLRQFAGIGISEEFIDECREVQCGAGPSMAKQRSLFA